MPESPVRVLLDVSPACVPASSRAGLARVALQLGSALARRTDVDLTVSAWGWVQAMFDLPDAVTASAVVLRPAAITPNAVEQAYSRQWMRFRDRGDVPGWYRRAGQLLNLVRNPVRGLDPSGFDVVHSTYSRVPAEVRKWGKPIVMTIHDVTPLVLRSDKIPEEQSAVMRRIVDSVEATDWVVAISEHTQRDFRSVTVTDRAERIVVIPDGVDRGMFKPAVDMARIASTRRRHEVSESPFFLTLSSLAPHKNVKFLLGLWPEVRRRHPDARLVVAGGRTQDRTALGAEFGASDGVHFTGFVPDESLAELFSACEAFLFPSVYEGFGLPLLEAMACGAPVVASNRASIPEVVGDAGDLIDPEDAGAWVVAISGRLQSGPRSGPHKPSIDQASKFDWDKVAAEYVALYRKACAR